MPLWPSMPDPSSFDDVARVIGYTSARILSAWYPGRSVYVPRVARDDHPLARLLGLSVLCQLVEVYACCEIDVPTEKADDRWRRDRQITLLLLAGQTPNEVAEEVGLTARRVEQLRQELLARGWLAYAAAGRRMVPLRDPVVD